MKVAKSTLVATQSSFRSPFSLSPRFNIFGRQSSSGSRAPHPAFGHLLPREKGNASREVRGRHAFSPREKVPEGRMRGPRAPSADRASRTPRSLDSARDDGELKPAAHVLPLHDLVVDLAQAAA